MEGGTVGVGLHPYLRPRVELRAAPGQDGKREGVEQPIRKDGLGGPGGKSACLQRSVSPIVPSVDSSPSSSRREGGL